MQLKRKIPRDLRLDTLRGIFLVIMAVNHLGGNLSHFTNEPFGYITAATAFVMLSAYMYSYTSMAVGANFKALTKQACKRAAKIYRYHLALMVLLLIPTLLSTVYRDYLGYLYPTDSDNVFVALGYAALLLHQPPFMHILPLYIVMSLLSPMLLIGLHRGYGRWIIGASLAVWMFGQVFDPMEWLTAASGTGASPAQFNLFSWQVLWVAGLYIGFLHQARKRTVFFENPAYIITAAIMALGFFLLKHHVIASPESIYSFFDNSDFSVLRLANTVSQVVLFLWVVKKVPANVGLPWFSFLGRYSLQVFTYHVLVVCLLAPVSWRIAPNFGAAADLAYTLMVVASMTLPALGYLAYENLKRLGRTAAIA